MLGVRQRSFQSVEAFGLPLRNRRDAQCLPVALNNMSRSLDGSHQRDEQAPRLNSISPSSMATSGEKSNRSPAASLPTTFLRQSHHSNETTISSSNGTNETSRSSLEEHRPMNDSTMPPPSPSAFVKSEATTVSGTKKPSSTSVVPPRARFGLHDWKRLVASSTDLAQRKGSPIRKDITPQEVAQHNRNHDGWIILRGRVYNIGPYLPYHPGGVNIFKSVLGKDATALFDKYHRWVNIDGLIGPLLLGTVTLSGSASKSNPFNVIPAKELQLGNAPRVPVTLGSSSNSASKSLLFVPTQEEDGEDDDNLLMPPPSSF